MWISRRQGRDVMRKHQFALQLIRDSTVFPNYLSLNPSSHKQQQHREGM